MASILPMAAYLMQAAQGGSMDGPLIPPAPPGYPPHTQPLPMDMPQQAAPVSQAVEAPVEDEIVAKGLDPIQHKGLFGVKGTLRDVLGLLGDSYLMVNGRNPYYAGIRRQEAMSDELAGRYQNNEEENFINNPLLTMQRLAESGYGEQAQSLYKDYTQNEKTKAAQAQAAAQLARQEARDNQLALQGEATRSKTIQETLARTYSGISDQTTLDQFNAMIGPRLKGTLLEGHPLPRTIKEAQRYGIQPYQQQRLEDFDEGLDISQQNANANSRRAAVARPRADSRAEIIERIGNKPPEKRTPGEQAAYENAIATGRGNTRGRRTGGGATSSGGAPSAPPRKKNDAYRTSDGRIWRSPDGKSWQ